MSLLYKTKLIDSILPCLCSVIDHKGCQYVVRTSVTHSPNSSCATFLFLTYFEIIFNLLLDSIFNGIFYFVNYPYYWIATNLWVLLVRVKLKTHNLMHVEKWKYSAILWGGVEMKTCCIPLLNLILFILCSLEVAS